MGLAGWVPSASKSSQEFLTLLPTATFTALPNHRQAYCRQQNLAFSLTTKVRNDTCDMEYKHPKSRADF